MKVLRVLALVVAALPLAFAAERARAEVPVDLELVLAVDVSLSMDLEEQRLQRDGYIAAFRDPEIIRAIRAGGVGRIAVQYVEWAGPSSQQVVLPWTLIDGAAAGLAFAEKLDAQPISRMRMTSVSSALDFSGTQFGKSEFVGARRVIDISGDGPNNAGVPVTGVRDDLVANGIVINGLPIMVRPSSAGFFDITALDHYYEDCVIGGPGAFMIPIRDKSEFAPAIRRKLLLEISAIEPAPKLWHAQIEKREPRIDCLIGERMWQRYMDGRFRE